MRPIEIIHSIERIHEAKEIQEHHSNDPHKVTGELNIKKIQDEVILQQSSVPKSDESESINPDGKGKEPQNPQKKALNNKSEEEANNTEPEKNLEPEKGKHLDITI